MPLEKTDVQSSTQIWFPKKDKKAKLRNSHAAHSAGCGGSLRRPLPSAAAELPGLDQEQCFDSYTNNFKQGYIVIYS